MRAPLLLALALAPTTAHAVVTDYFVDSGVVTMGELAVEPGDLAVCVSPMEGSGVIERSWTHWYAFHFVLASSCGAYPLDFEASSNADGTFDVRGYLETPSATGWCKWDEETYGALRCDVKQGALHVRGTFASDGVIF